MSYSPIPKWTITDANGEPVVGGTVEFFEAGTSTPKDVYSDAARTISAGDTLTTDALGQIGPVYLDTAEATKAVCKDEDGVTLWTEDDLTAPIGTSISVFALTRSVSPLDFGAVGDGVLDESTQVQQAIDAGSGFVDLAGKTYRCDSALTLSGTTRIINGTLDASNISSGTSFISATGTLGSGVFASSSIDGGDKTINLSSTATLISGRWIKISSNAEWVSGIKDGELARISSIDSGTQIKLAARSSDTYTTANSAKVEQLTTIKDISFEDVRIIGSTLTSMDVLHFKYCENVSLRNVRIESFESSGARFTSCVHCNVYSLDCRDSDEGKAIAFDGVCLNCSVDGLKASSVDGSLFIGGTIDGVARGISASNCASMAETDGAGASSCVLFAANSFGCRLSDSILSCGDGAFNYGVLDLGVGNSVDSCSIDGALNAGIRKERSSTKSLTYEAIGYARASTYTNNRITSIENGFEFDAAASAATDRAIAQGNCIDYAGESAFQFESTNGVANIDVSSNTAGTVKRLVYFTESGTYNKVSVRYNIVQTCEQVALIDIDDDSTDVDVSGNVAMNITGSLNIGIDLDLATGKTLSGLILDGNTLGLVDSTARNAIKVTSQDAGALTDFSIDGNRIEFTDQDDNYHAIEVYDAKHGSICKNSVGGVSVIAGVYYGGASATVVEDIGNVRISCNRVRLTGELTATTPEGTAITVDASGSADIEGVTIGDNDIIGHSTGVSGVPLVLVSAATGLTIKNVHIPSNRIDGSGKSNGIEIASVDTDGIQYVSMPGNNIVAQIDAVVLTNCRNVSVSSGTLRTASVAGDDAIIITGCDNVSVSGASLVSDKTTSPSQCATVNTSVSVVFCGCVMSGGYNMLVTDSSSADDLNSAIGNMWLDRGSTTLLSGAWIGTYSLTAGDYPNGNQTV